MYIKNISLCLYKFFPIWTNNCFFLWNKFFFYYIISLSSLILSWDNFPLHGGICRTSPETHGRSRVEKRDRPWVSDDVGLIENGFSKTNQKKKIAPRYSGILIHVYWIVHYSLNPPPPLKTFTKHLHNEYLIKINTLLLR